MAFSLKQAFPFGRSTVSDAAGAVSDIFSAFSTAEGLKIKAEGDRAEATSYGLAADLAEKNEEFAETSTAIKTMQAQREAYLGIGAETSDIEGSGFQLTGTGVDLLRSANQQAALTKQVIGAQGQIQEAGYAEQAGSYENMEAAAAHAADEEDSLSGTSKIVGLATGGVKALSSIASVAGLFGL